MGGRVYSTTIPDQTALFFRLSGFSDKLESCMSPLTSTVLLAEKTGSVQLHVEQYPPERYLCVYLCASPTKVFQRYFCLSSYT